MSLFFDTKCSASCLGGDISPPVKYHTPLTGQSLAFYPSDPQRFSYVDSSKIITYPHAIVNGIYTRSINRHGGHDFLAIRPVFQPGALLRSTGIPSHELTNTFVDAIWGKAIRPVSERLNSTDNLADMLTIIELFIVGLVQLFRKTHHAVDATSRLMLQQQQRISLDQLADIRV